MRMHIKKQKICSQMKLQPSTTFLLAVYCALPPVQPMLHWSCAWLGNLKMHIIKKKKKCVQCNCSAFDPVQWSCNLFNLLVTRLYGTGDKIFHEPKQSQQTFQARLSQLKTGKVQGTKLEELKMAHQWTRPNVTGTQFSLVNTNSSWRVVSPSELSRWISDIVLGLHYYWTYHPIVWLELTSWVG